MGSTWKHSGKWSEQLNSQWIGFMLIFGKKKKTKTLFCREWTGDLKKLPNIKLRTVNNKGLDTKSKGTENNQETENNKQDEEDDLGNEPDGGTSMSDWQFLKKNSAVPKLPPRWRYCPRVPSVLPELILMLIHVRLRRFYIQIFIEQPNMHHLLPEY